MGLAETKARILAFSPLFKLLLYHTYPLPVIASALRFSFPSLVIPSGCGTESPRDNVEGQGNEDEEEKGARIREPDGIGGIERF